MYNVAKIAVMGKIKSQFDLNCELTPFAIRFERCGIQFERVAVRFDLIWPVRDSIWPCGDLADRSPLQALNLKRPVYSVINCFVNDMLIYSWNQTDHVNSIHH